MTFTRAREAADLPPVTEVTEGGLVTRSDGALLRYLRVAPHNPLALDHAGCDRMTRGLTELLTSLPTGANLQCYVHATPLPVDDLVPPRSLAN